MQIAGMLFQTHFSITE
ncbi:MAG: hypothetical protein ACLVBP_00925 [Ruminococcus sp.]